MNIFNGVVLVSASSLHIYAECPRRFLYITTKESFSDSEFSRNLTTTKVFEQGLLTANRNKMVTVSLEQQLQKDVNISASSLGQFKKCPRSFNYKMTRTPQSDPFDITPYAFGTIVHSKLDDFYHGIQKEYGSLLKAPMVDLFKKFYVSEELKEFILNKVRSTNSWTESKQKVYTHFYEALLNDFKFIKSILDKGCEPVFNFWFGTTKNPLEVKSINIPRLRLIGEIDWYYINPRGNITIEDRKTSTSTFYLDYDQLHLYAMALEQYYENQGDQRKVDELNFCLVRSGKRFPIPFGSDQRETLIANLSSLETSVELNSFRPIRSRNCERCAWRTLCSKQAGTKQEQGVQSFLDDLKSNIDKQ